MKNLFAFHGAGARVGTTMISQSVAEMAATSNKDMNILFVALSGSKNTQYVMEDIECIDNFKMKIDSKMLNGHEFLNACRQKENLFMLGGVVNEREKRHYYPEAAAYLLDSVGEQFDLIIADTGSDLDNGLALGGLLEAKERFMVLAQMESTIKRYEELKGMYGEAGIDFDAHILNKFSNKDPYSLRYLKDRLGIDKGKFITVTRTAQDAKAEMEYKTLLEYGNENYMSNISIITNRILNTLGRGCVEQGKNKKWGNFI